jgi:hypothetical protein
MMKFAIRGFGVNGAIYWHRNTVRWSGMDGWEWKSDRKQATPLTHRQAVAALKRLQDSFCKLVHYGEHLRMYGPHEIVVY